MTTLGTLAAGIQNVSAVRRSEVYLTELGEDDRPLVTDSFKFDFTQNVPQWRKFQYFPETISDTKQVGYQPKEVPGGSLPLYQWSNSGERAISFTAVFTTDIDHLLAQSTIDFPLAGGGTSLSSSLGDQSLPSGVEERLRTVDGAVNASYTRLKASGQQDRNPFIPGMLIWLRRFMLPRYGDNAEIGVPITRPPRKLLLHMPGTEFELFGGGGGFSAPGGGLLCVMTTCDINIEALFPSGNIRIATVSLAFSEVPQQGGAVRFPSASPLDAYVSWHPLAAAGQSTTSGVSE